jgi:S1-C subfamily serine protease
MQFGSAELRNVIAASLPDEFKPGMEKRTGIPTLGLIGADALLNYKVGIDYAHSAVYFEQVSKYAAPGIDVVGLVLRPEVDGKYTIIGVPNYEGKPAVADVHVGDRLISVDGGRATGATMGQVWSLLEGSPGTVRTLVLERDGKQFTVKAPIREFLPPAKTPAKVRPH